MEKIRFTASVSIYDVNFNYINSKVIQLSFKNTIDESVISSGFEILNEHNFIPQGDYTAYTTIYRKVSDTIYYLSKDESVYVPPEPIPDPHELTLDEVKQAKISEITKLNTNAIISGTSVTINDVSTNFTFKETEQKELTQLFYNTLISGLSMSYQNVLYTSSELINIYKTLSLYKGTKEAYLQQLINYINSLIAKSDVNSVVYGQELVGEYLSSYNTSISNKESEITSSINTYLSKREYSDNLYETDVSSQVIGAYEAIAILYET